MNKINDTLNFTPYIATDRRVYNGCPSSDMQKELESIAKLERKIDELEKRLTSKNRELHCTYFPMEGKYMVFDGIKMISGNFHHSKQDALIEAIKILETAKEVNNET